MKKLFIKSYGCQMNFYDSGKMGDVLKPLGFEMAEDMQGADMVVLNTCHIRERATEKVYSELGLVRMQKQTQENPMLIAVAGCVGQAEGEEIFKRAPFVDIVVGPQSYHTLPELVAKAWRKGGQEIRLDFPAMEKFDALPQADISAASAFLAVQEGCDKFCSFCVVPYTRGAEYSRPVADIYREALSLVSKGAKELTLLGQNVNAYHGEGPEGQVWNFGTLIRRLAEIPGLKRLRYTTSHPRDMEESLITAHRDVGKLMPYLHLPVQSGSDRILKMMNRKHTAAEYLATIARIRAVNPDIAFSSDFIVGFPGETEADFEATLQIVREVDYAYAYSFKYSPRPGTPAAAYEGQVPEEVKDERLKALQALITSRQLAFNLSKVGQEMEVLLERPGKFPGQMIGKSPWMQSVYVENASHLKGEIIRVKITGGYANSLAGEYVSETLKQAA